MIVCRPSFQMSPRWHRRSSSNSAGTASAFGSVVSSPSRIRSISTVSNPVISRLKSRSRLLSSLNSKFNNSMLHLPSSVSLLSAIRYARFWASVRCDRIIAGTSVIPASCAAATRPCPAMISKFSSNKTGLINPNSRIDSRIFATWARLCNFGLCR